jgi:hypothetical protein
MLLMKLSNQCWQWRCQGDIGRGAMSLPSHAGDGTAKSCWRWHCRGNVGHGVMSLSSLASDGAAEATLVMALPRRCWSLHYRVLLEMTLLR